jgi:glycosyltransferase involved in cell wall biosynthesis
VIGREKYAGGKPYFVFLGAIHPRKNIINLIRAFELFKQEDKDEIQLVLAGRPSWHTEEFFDVLDKSPVRTFIHLPGYVPTDEAVTLIGASEAMVYPSWYEGFGLPLLEAMAADVPVISSNAASLPEVAGDAALLFDPASPDALAACMSRVLREGGLREMLLKQGRARLGAFSWDTAAHRIYDILAGQAGR